MGQWAARAAVSDVARHSADENVPYDYRGADAQVLWGFFFRVNGVSTSHSSPALFLKAQDQRKG